MSVTQRLHNDRKHGVAVIDRGGYREGEGKVVTSQTCCLLTSIGESHPPRGKKTKESGFCIYQESLKGC